MIIELNGVRPTIAEDAYIAPTAVLIGNVTVKAGANIWFGAVLRGDTGAIVIGERTSVQDNVVIHVNEHEDTIIGDDVLLGHGAVLEGCTIGDGALIGMGAVVLSGASVGKQTLVVIFGPARSGRFFVGALALAYLLLPLLVLAGLPGQVALVVLLTSPIAAWQAWRIRRGAATDSAAWDALGFWSIGLLMAAALLEAVVFVALTVI